jgi:hypothetical protein
MFTASAENQDDEQDEARGAILAANLAALS